MRPCATCSLAIIGPGPVALYGHKIKDQKSYGFAAKYQNRLYNIKKRGGVATAAKYKLFIYHYQQGHIIICLLSKRQN